MYRTSCRGGFTLVEMVIAVTLSALVIAGVTAAVYSGLFSYEATTEIATARQAVQAVLDRMTAEIRLADNVSTTTGTLTITTGANSGYQYELTSGGNLVYRVRESGTYSSDYVLLDTTDDITVNTFSVNIKKRAVDGTYYATIVKINLGVTVGDYTFDANASAAPRNTPVSKDK